MRPLSRVREAFCELQLRCVSQQVPLLLFGCPRSAHRSLPDGAIQKDAVRWAIRIVPFVRPLPPAGTAWKDRSSAIVGKSNTVDSPYA